MTTRSPDGPDPARAANVVGALALVLTDRITDAVEDAAAQAETGAVALSALRHVLPPDPSIDLVRQVLGLTHSGTVRLVDRLEAAGSVDRVACTTDARGQEAVLTASGMDRLRTAADTHLDGVRRYFLERLDGSDLDAIERSLGGLALALEPENRSTHEGCPPAEA